MNNLTLPTKALYAGAFFFASLILTGCDPSSVTGSGEATMSNSELLGSPLVPNELSSSTDSLLIDFGDVDMSTQEDTVDQDPPSGGS